MGRKSKKNSAVHNKLNIQRRKEVIVLVDKVLRLTSVFQATNNLAKNWEHHLEIEAILHEVNNIERSWGSGSERSPRQTNVESYLKWLAENGVQSDGVEISDFEGYELGLKAKKDFKEGSLILTVPKKVMMSVKDAEASKLGMFIQIDPLLQNMPNITLALFLMLEKANPDSFWKPYIELLPQKYPTILYFTREELLDLKPSPVFECSLKLFRSIARQYAYFYNKIHSVDLPVCKTLQHVFTYDNYRWAVSTVMTRQNNIQLKDSNLTAFIPLWDMCNHEDGKITTDFNNDLDRGECYALRDFKAGEQIFIFYGARPNSDLFLHNGFVFKNNQYDSFSLALGVSTSDPQHDVKVSLLSKLGLAGVTHFNLYKGDAPMSPELLAFIRIFNMHEEELQNWSNQGLPGELVSSHEENAETIGMEIERRAHTYLLTRCRLLKSTYKEMSYEPYTIHRRNIQWLKECEVQMLDGGIKYLEDVLKKIPTAPK